MESTSVSRTRPGSIESRREIVELAEAHMRAHIGTPMRLSSLCRIVGLSERGLRNAFYSVRGMSPTRYVLAERLQAVRNALSDPAAKPATVTDVATDYGFYELGRFAATYKEAFGEAPSETLRRTTRQSALNNRRTRKESPDACTKSPDNGKQSGQAVSLDEGRH